MSNFGQMIIETHIWKALYFNFILSKRTNFVD